jgi:hypothetical protein
VHQSSTDNVVCVHCCGTWSNHWLINGKVTSNGKLQRNGKAVIGAKVCGGNRSRTGTAACVVIICALRAAAWSESLSVLLGIC